MRGWETQRNGALSIRCCIHGELHLFQREPRCLDALQQSKHLSAFILGWQFMLFWLVPAPSALALIQHSTCFTLNPHVMSLTGKRSSPSHKFNLPFPSTSLKVLQRVFNSFQGWVSQTGVVRASIACSEGCRCHRVWAGAAMQQCPPSRAPCEQQCMHWVPLNGAGGQNLALLATCKAGPSRAAFDLLGTGRCGTAWEQRVRTNCKVDK